jgi:hypothetical protein
LLQDLVNQLLTPTLWSGKYSLQSRRDLGMKQSHRKEISSYFLWNTWHNMLPHSYFTSSYVSISFPFSSSLPLLFQGMAHSRRVKKWLWNWLVINIVGKYC